MRKWMSKKKRDQFLAADVMQEFHIPTGSSISPSTCGIPASFCVWNFLTLKLFVAITASAV
jgi:hypothetical protein